MGKLYLIIIGVFFPFSINAQQQDSVFMFSYFKNNGKDGLHMAYSHEGYKWAPLKNDQSFLTPVLSKDSLMRDPCIIRGADNLFHLVWTVSWNEKGIGYARSADLINWSEQKYIPVMVHEDSARNCWAPEITFDKKKKCYMIYWATSISGRFSQGDTAGDSRYNHRMYYVTTRDFKKFSKTRLLYDQGFNVIDASIVAHGKKYIMFLKDETRIPAQKNIRIAVSNKINKNYSKPSEAITGNYWAEGPTAFRKGTLWIVYFDKYRVHHYGAISSTDLVNWTDISDKIFLPKGIRHGSIFKISKAEFDKLILTF